MTPDWIKEIAALVVESGYECVGIERVVENQRHILRIYIDSIGGISLGDCEAVSKKVSHFLDENALIPEQRYYLEVSSPGIERPLFSLEDFKRFSGKRAFVRLRKREGEKSSRAYQGRIHGVKEKSVILLLDDGTEVQLEIDSVAKAHLLLEEKPSFKASKRREKTKNATR